MRILTKAIYKGDHYLKRLSPLFTESYAEMARDRGLDYFVRKEMPTDYDWRKYSRTYSPYFLKWGLRVPMCEAKFYEQCNGISSDLYITRGLAYHYIYPYLNRYQFIPAYHDKSVMKFVANSAGVQTPRNLLECTNGWFFDESRMPIDASRAIEKLISIKEPIIIKPSIGGYGGHGVRLINGKGLSRSEAEELCSLYGDNFLVQSVVRQHAEMALFNKTSLNTLRIVTRRHPDGQVKILYAVIRFGCNGAVCDNASSGGAFTMVGHSGEVTRRVAYSYKAFPTPVDVCWPSNIPSWGKVKTAVLKMHGQMPHFNRMAWDMAVDIDGNPVMIEYNIRSDLAFQQAVGPIYSEEELDWLMLRVSKMSVRFSLQPCITFPDRKGILTWHCSSDFGWY